MKKIIELAKALALETFANSREVALALDELETAIAEYKQSEATPITEEWLKEHGWYISDYNPLHNARLMVGADMLEYDEDRQDLTIFRDYEPESGVYADALIDNVDNVAKLYDACELCGIELND